MNIGLMMENITKNIQDKNNMLQVQQLFREKSYLEAINYLTELGVIIKDCNNIIHLDYDIISAKNHPIVKECRGLALFKDTYEIFRYGFDRFYNYNESSHDKIDYSQPFECEEKADGSLIFLNWYNNQWVIGTRGAVFPTQNVLGFNYTFPDLFKKYFQSFDRLNKNYQYVFELCSIENRVVVKYNIPKIVLILIRDENWNELDSQFLDNEAVKLNVSRPVKYIFNNFNDILDSLKSLTENKEGYVVKQLYNNKYLRVKIKSMQYLALHKIFIVKSLNSLVRLVLCYSRTILEHDFVEYLDVYDRIYNRIHSVLSELTALYNNNIYLLYEQNDYKVNRKNFAQKIMKHKLGNILFGLADNKYKDLQQWLESHNTPSGIRKLIDLFELKKYADDSWKLNDNVEEDI